MAMQFELFQNGAYAQGTM